MNAIWTLALAEFQEGLRNRWVLAAVAILATLAFSLALIALTLAFDAIVGEHERGTLLLLSYPLARWQVMAGKFLGHLAILACAILFGCGSVGVYLAVTGGAGSNEWLLFATMIGSTLLLGAVFIALGYLISVLVPARATAAGAAMAVWLFMVVLYDLLLLGLVLADTEQRLSASVFGGLILLNPADIYRLFNLADSETASLVSGSTGLLEASAFYVTAMGKSNWNHPEKQSAAWINARSAWYVIDSDKKGGMGMAEAIPFAEEAAAKKFVEEFGGRPLRLAHLPEAYILGHGQQQGQTQ